MAAPSPATTLPGADAMHASTPDDPLAKRTDYYQQVRHEVLAQVPAGARRVLDVGCAEGALGQHLLARGAQEVIGIEFVAEVAARARTRLTAVHCGDVETMALPFAPQSFDCIVFADVLEHLRDPNAALLRFIPLLRDSGTIVASIPNVRHYSVLHMLAEGLWTYQPQGLMDRTHLRFFTKCEIEAMFAQVGLTITSLGAASVDPAYTEVHASSIGKPLVDFGFGRVILKDLRPDDLIELFVIQYLITATK
jgi:2-polyprenyl-3-methyl-5-hydroxy-6-metoxy-1,4-benzoquinol methylase